MTSLPYSTATSGDKALSEIQKIWELYTLLPNPMRNAYKMIGNAVPVDLAYWVAKTIKEDLGLK